MDFKQVLKILKAKALIIVAIVVALTSAVGAYSSLYSKPVYEASAKVILTNDNIEEGVIDYNALLANGMLMQTYADIIKTPRLMNLVAGAYPQFGMTGNELRSIVSIGTSDNQIMTISVRNDSYERAMDVANAVAAVMIAEIPKIMKMDNVLLLDKAPTLPNATPINLSLTMKIAITFVMSLLFSFGIVLLWEYLNDRIRTEEDVEEILGSKPLSVLPRVKKDEIFPVLQMEQASDKPGDRGAYVAVSQ